MRSDNHCWVRKLGSMNKVNQYRALLGLGRRKMRQNKQIAMATVALALFLVATPALAPRANAAAMPCLSSSKCNLLILSPGSGAALNNNQTVYRSFIVSFATQNFTLVQPGTGGDVNTTTAGGRNQGHIHVFVDNAYVTLWANANGIPLTLAKGTHTIRLDLVNDFHQTFNPSISKSTTVNVIDPVSDGLQSTANSAQSTASNAQNYGLGALVVSVITLILVAYVAFRPRPKTTA